MAKTRVRVQTVAAQGKPTYVGMTPRQALTLGATVIAQALKGKVALRIFQSGASVYVGPTTAK